MVLVEFWLSVFNFLMKKLLNIRTMLIVYEVCMWEKALIFFGQEKIFILQLLMLSRLQLCENLSFVLLRKIWKGTM